jgi:thiamine biosynthesis lipoprotein
MTRAAPLSRRRAITIVAGCAGVPLLDRGRAARDLPALYAWNGTSLGSPARLRLYHTDRAAAAQVVARCAAEIERLEHIFALYREDSEITRLNRHGRIAAPAHDLRLVLADSLRLAELSGGAFDVSVQPLWDLYAQHFFGRPAPDPSGPPARAVAAALALVGWRDIEVSARQAVLARPGMGLALNGIAQGYVADRIVGIFRDAGCDRVLADLGHSELFALGRHPDRRCWHIGLTDPRKPERIGQVIDLCDGALCTSGGYGTKFEPSGRFHHLFDTATGASAGHYLAVSVFAPRAMIADALSTGIYVVPPERCAKILSNHRDVSALVTLPDGTTQRLSG